ncbi:MAG TPA: ribokinase [Candidatus Saccharimonadales bacterium]|nr:ribokinase [Candidatus Saccharimonadales bacterium]
MKNPHIVIVGSANIDIVVEVKAFPKIGQTLQGKNFNTFLGGKGANQAVAAARLGAEVTFIGCVGRDSFGEKILKSLKKEGIKTKIVQKGSSPTGTAIVTINEHADNQILVIPGANFALTKEFTESALESINKPEVLLLQLEVPLEIVTAAAIWGKKHGLLVILNPAPAPLSPLPKILLDNIDYIIPNEIESYTITGESLPLAAAKKLKTQGIPNIIITLSDKGALSYNGSPEFVPPFSVSAIDPTAAGDAFVSGVSIATFQKKSLKEAVTYANAIGALTATKLGAQPSLPTRDEVLNFLNHNHN